MSTLIAHPVRFDPAAHRYFAGDRELPSVTEIIAKSGLMGNLRFYTEAARDLGSAVHLACRYYDEGDLDESSVDPSVLPYLRAWMKFRQDIGFRADVIEQPMRDPGNTYAGTPDRVTLRSTELCPKAVWDIKTGQPEPWHSIQLAAYCAMLDSPLSYRRFGVYLTDSGSYKVCEYPLQRFLPDRATFMSALNIYNWKKDNGAF